MRSKIAVLWSCERLMAILAARGNSEVSAESTVDDKERL